MIRINQRKTILHFVIYLVFLLSSITAINVKAQNIIIENGCFESLISLPPIPDIDGKPAYEGTGTVLLPDIDPLPIPGVAIAVYWSTADNLWFIAFDGQPYLSNTDTGPTPPTTGWVAIDVDGDGSNICEMASTVVLIPPPTIICPSDATASACQTQGQVNTQFANWLATAVGSGGMNGVLTNNNTGAPSACGGNTTVIFTYINDVDPDTITCSAIFTVSPPPTVVLTCPVNTTVAACQSQAAVNAQFSAWLTTVSGSGGCNGVLTNNNTGAPPACGGITTVTFTYTSTCAPLTVTCQATFTVAAPPTVVLTCPTNTTTAACQSQAAVNAAFSTWLATASGSGGCSGALTNNNTGAPPACGGSTTVTFTYNSSCAPTTVTCQATFTVAAPPTVTLTCPTNTTAAACQTQAAVNTAFATWLATASGSGGCNGVLTDNNTGAPPACGGSTTVTFTYTSSCAPTTVTCQATFTVAAPPTITLTCPTNTTAAACQSQAAVNAAFATWLATASGSGGCSGVLTDNNTGAPSACGGSTTVTFTYNSSCAPTTVTCQATFTVAAPPTVTLTCPTNTTVAACQTQAAVNTAFATWLATASGSGGCNGVLTDNNTGAPPACGGSTTVTFTYTSSCAPTTATCQATFTVASPPQVSLICPINTSSAICQTQSSVDAAFAAWLASASGSGGCNGVLTNNNTGAPLACGGSTTVTFTYTSSCAPFTTTCQAVFTVPAVTIPLIIACPADTMLGTNPDSIIVNSMPVVTSSCGTPVIMSVDGPISRDGCFMSYVKTFTVSDFCNQPTTCTQTISWLDSLTINVRFEGPLEACEGDDSTYLIITEISGGTPPYTIDYGDIILRTEPPTCIEIGVGGTFMQTTDSQIDTVMYQDLPPGDYTIQVLGVSDQNGCTGDPDTSVSFVIYPSPVGVDTAYEIESCITDSLILDSLIQCRIPSTFEWYSVEAVGSDVPFDNPNVVGDTVMPAGSGNMITDIITNITLDTQTIIYYVVPTSITGECEGEPFYISKTLLPFELSWSAVDEVNFSLDANCMGLITPSTLLTGANICDALFTIEIQYPEGSNSYEPANKVDETHVGKCLQVSVIDIITGNSTWGTVCIEDKFGPTITGVPDTCIYCIEGILPSRTGQATATDCGGVEEIWYKDITQDYECNENSDTASVITRVWYARDGLNNIAVDTQIITVKNLPDSLLRQPDVLVELACGQGTSPADIARLKGIPAAYAHYINPVTGLATPILEGGVCNFVAGYEDSKILDACGPDCASSYKFVRTWTVLNWCTRVTRKFSQLIKVTDSIAPNVTIAPPAKEYSVSAWECAVTIDMPSAIVTDNCDDHAALVAIDGPIGSTVRKINGNWRAYDVPKGVHEFIYTATDCCGNLSTASVTITVVDKIAPVASAKEYITVSLTRSGVEEEDGIAKITPEMIDNNSYDNCTDVYLEVRRDDASPVCLNEGDLWNHDNNASTPMVRWNNNTTYNGTINGRDEINPIHEHDRIYDTDQGQYVKVCCEDIGQEVKVWLRVWDDADMDGIFGSAGDNYNETWAIVKVEDKIVPTLVCERDITTYCDRADVKLSLGKWTDVAGNVPASYLPWIDGVCKDYALEYRDEGFITTCNTTLREQPIIRTYRIKGTNVTCTVNVYILDVETEPKLDWPINLHTWTKCTLTEEDVLNNTIKAVGLRSVMVAGIEGTSQIVLEDYYTYVPYYWREWLGTDYNTPNLGLYCFDSGTTEIADPKNGTNGLTPIGGGLTTDLQGKTRFNPNWRDIGCRVFGRKIIIDEYNVGEGCKKWIVRFEYIDWCNPEWAACVSTIYKYEDETPPTIEVSMSDTIAIDANCVTGWMTSPKGLDDGGCEAGYRWVVTIQTGGAGLVQTGTGSNPKLTFNNVPVGKWTVHYKLIDGCGNVTEKEAMLLVLGKAPTPYCISLSSAVMKNGTVELWARDFDKNSFDNCIDGPLYFTFDNQHPVLSKLAQVHYFKGAGLDAKESEYLSGDAQKWIPDTKETVWPNGDIKIEVTGGTSGRLFGCNVGDGSTFPVANVKMTVWDRDLLSDFCEVTLTLIDNQGACGPTSQVVISGNVTIESGAGLANAEMILESALPEYPKKTRTNESGAYTFGGVPVGVDYAVKANLDENYKNGVNTLDLVHIQRHILSLKKLTSPYKMIAADASGDAAIRVEDLVALRKLILGVADDLPGNTSWRFVDAKQEMRETPWPFNEVMSHASIKEGSVDNFIAVKIGDVDGSAKTGFKGENEVTPRNSGVTLSTEDRMVKKGEMVEVQLSADQFTEIYGFQMAMKLKGLTLISAEGRGIEIGDDNYATPMSNVMTMSWSIANAKSVSEGSTVMTMRFKATQDGQLSKMIEVSNDILRSEAYVGSEMEVSKVTLELRNARPTAFHLSQNEPNPWRGETVVNYELPKAGKVTLTVLDITGKMVAQKTVDGAAGKNTIGLTKAELGGAAGVMIYRLESGGLSTQKRMIVIE